MVAFFVAVPMYLTSCKPDSPQGEGSIKTDDNYTIKTIDGCEYIEFDEGMAQYRVYSLTHKGNCKNHAQPTP